MFITFAFLIFYRSRRSGPVVTHRSTVARTVMCRQDGRGRFPVLLDDLCKCRTNSQRKSQLRFFYMICTLNDIYNKYNKLHEH